MKTCGRKKIGKYKIMWHSHSMDENKYLRVFKIAIAEGLKIHWCKEYSNPDNKRITPKDRDIIINNAISMVHSW